GEQHEMERVDATHQIRVERVDRREEHADGYRRGEDRRDRPECAVVLDEVRGDMQAGAGGDDRGDHEHLAVAPDERAVAVPVQHLSRRHDEVHPPDAERQPDASMTAESDATVPTTPSPSAITANAA